MGYDDKFNLQDRILRLVMERPSYTNTLIGTIMMKYDPKKEFYCLYREENSFRIEWRRSIEETRAYLEMEMLL